VGRLGDEIAALRRALEQANAGPETPHDAQVLMKAIDRHSAAEEGRPLPPYSQAELGCLFRQDRDMVDGEADEWRSSPGWEGAEDQALVDAWEADARRRLEEIEAGATLEEVCEEHDLDDMEEEDDG
jgi:hypothetical protein